MTPRLKIAATLALLLVLGGLGTADYYFSGNEYAASTTSSESSVSTVTAPAGAVAKNSGEAVQSVIEAEGLTSSASDDLTMLSQVTTNKPALNSLAILQNGDRAGSVTWEENANVKTTFNAIKEALLTAFSAEVQGLRDETVQEAGKPVRNILTFLDPALSEERIIFVRVRERLYEFHVATGKEETMDALIDALTSR